MRFSLRRNGRSKQTELMVSEVGVILIRAFPQDSHMTMFDIDSHRVPAILRALADSFEAEHCAGQAMAEHEHEEAS